MVGLFLFHQTESDGQLLPSSSVVELMESVVERESLGFLHGLLEESEVGADE